MYRHIIIYICIYKPTQNFSRYRRTSMHIVLANITYGDMTRVWLVPGSQFSPFTVLVRTGSLCFLTCTVSVHGRLFSQILCRMWCRVMCYVSVTHHSPTSISIKRMSHVTHMLLSHPPLPLPRLPSWPSLPSLPCSPGHFLLSVSQE